MMETPQIQNIMSTVDLGCKLDLNYIFTHCSKTKYDPKKFNPVIMRLKVPKSTALIFTSGKIVVTGTKDEKSSENAARKYASLLKKLQFPVKFSNFRITNIVASCQLPFRPPLFNKNFLPSEKMKFVDYEPELFPGLVYRTGITFIIFRSGKVIMTKAKTREEIHNTYAAFVKSINSTNS